MAFKKTYRCPIEVEFPDSEEDKKFLQERVKNLVLNSTQSAMDLNFVKEIILEEHTQEIVSLDFDVIELKKLPWSSLIFECVDIERGSTIVKFNLGFKEPPRNQADLSAYRLIELVVLTIIENLQFIKEIKKTEIDRNRKHIVLSANISLKKRFSKM